MRHDRSWFIKDRGERQILQIRYPAFPYWFYLHFPEDEFKRICPSFTDTLVKCLIVTIPWKSDRCPALYKYQLGTEESSKWLKFWITKTELTLSHKFPKEKFIKEHKFWMKLVQKLGIFVEACELAMNSSDGMIWIEGKKVSIWEVNVLCINTHGHDKTRYRDNSDKIEEWDMKFKTAALRRLNKKRLELGISSKPHYTCKFYF